MRSNHLGYNVLTKAPLFDVSYVASTPKLFDEYLAYPLSGVRGLRSCCYNRWQSEFDETVNTFKSIKPKHCASIDKVLVASSLYNLASTGIGNYLDINKPFPVFIRGTGALRNELSLDNPSLALEGGICLFQPGELFLILNDKNATKVDLFYTASRSPDSIKAIQTYGVQGVVCYRRLPSLQDYLSIYRLISFAVTFNAPVVVGLPDLEYIAETYRILGKETAEKFNLPDLIMASSRQIRQLVISIEQLLGATVIINSIDTDVTVRRAMLAACNDVMSILLKSVDPIVKRRDLVGYISMPLVPKYLFLCRLIISVLPVNETRTIKTLYQLFPSMNNTFIVFPDLPFQVTTKNANHSLVRAQLSSSVLKQAQHNLSVLPLLLN